MPWMKEKVTGQLRYVETDDIEWWDARGWQPTQSYENPTGASVEEIAAAVTAYLIDNPPQAGLVPYVHVQEAAQSVWTVEHNLGRFPIAWSLFDDDDIECTGYTVDHLDLNTSRVSMDIPTAGTIRLI